MSKNTDSVIYLLRASRRGGHAVHGEKIVGIYPTQELAHIAMNDLIKAKPKHTVCVTFGVMQATTKTSRYWMRSFRNQPKPLYL